MCRLLLYIVLCTWVAFRSCIWWTMEPQDDHRHEHEEQPPTNYGGDVLYHRANEDGLCSFQQVMGQPVTWVTPHMFTTRYPRDVDFSIMLTFLEFYETLLKFAMFKLFHTLDLRCVCEVCVQDRECCGTHRERTEAVFGRACFLSCPRCSLHPLFGALRTADSTLNVGGYRCRALRCSWAACWFSFIVTCNPTLATMLSRTTALWIQHCCELPCQLQAKAYRQASARTLTGTTQVSADA